MEKTKSILEKYFNAESLLLGWERFWLDDVGLGIVKIITCYGCMIWWIVDIISAKERTKKYNYKKFIQKLSFV